MPVKTSARSLPSSSMHLLDDDAVQAILQTLDVSDLQTLKRANSQLRAAVHRVLQSPHFAVRRSLALREKEFNCSSFQINIKYWHADEGCCIEVHIPRRGRVRIEKNPPHGKYPILDWFCTGPKPDALIGLQDWNVAAIMDALPGIIGGWQNREPPWSFRTFGDEDKEDPHPGWTYGAGHDWSQRCFQLMSTWEVASIRAKAKAIWEKFEDWDLFDDPHHQVQDESFRETMNFKLAWLERRASSHPDLVASVVHAWLDDDCMREAILGIWLQEDEPGEARGARVQTLKYQALLDVALRVDDALIFMTTADQESWPEGEHYGSRWYTGYAKSAGEVLRRWAHHSVTTSPSEFADVLARFCCHRAWHAIEYNRPKVRVERLTADYLMPLLRCFARTEVCDEDGHSSDRMEFRLTAEVEAQFQQWLLHGEDAPLRDALLASVESSRHSGGMVTMRPRRPDLLPRCFGDESALTHPEMECHWSDRWLTGAC